MKVRHIYILLFILLFVKSYSQGEANIWYFGYNSGLDFATGTPVILGNSQQQTVEGSATISDSSGQLLFYTDGNFVWNKNHEIMANGSGLLGNPSSTQSAVIVPKPNSASIYYIFTVTLLGENDGVRFTEVDMNLNGGLGDVTSNKNISLLTPATEKITAVKKNNCEDFWVVVHKYGNNSFHAYSISSLGVDTTPIISNVGSTISNVPNKTIGYLKFSPDGKKLLSSNYQQNVELFDFDNATGIISNPRIISNKFANYGAEFSPLGNVAYITTGDFYPLELYQYDLSSPNIIATETKIYESTDVNHLLGALQLSTNGKIYLSINNLNTISVINDPEVLGLGCNLGLHSISIGSGLSKLGLPQFIQSYFSVGINFNNVCLGNASLFSYTSNQTINGVIWDFGDGNTSNLNNPTHTYSSPGTYSVVATISSNSGTIIKCKQIIVSAVPSANPIDNQVICDNANMNYDLTSNNSVILGTQSQSTFGVSYFSSMSDAIMHTNTLNSIFQLPIGTTTFFAKLYSLSNKDCYEIKSFTVNLIQKPIINQPSNIVMCENAPYDGFENFILSNQNNTILDGLDPSNYTITYHLTQFEANTNVNPLPTNYQNIAASQEIYVRLESNSNSNCYDTASFLIEVYKKPIITNIPDLFICDDLSNDGFEFFDFSNQITEVLGLQSQTNYAVTFHLTLNEAQQGINEIQNNYINISNPQTIFVRIENNLYPDCNEIDDFKLIVKNKPVLNLEDVYAICVGSSLTISAPSGYSSYLWSNGSTSSSTTITQEGNYSITVFNDYGEIICENTKDFVVNNSNIATITNLAINDLNDNGNSIYVSVSGDGDYVYSLNGYNYQESPGFYNLSGGEYTVYVKDKKGCGIAFENVFLMMYPKYFTPNNDGFNDFWRIKFSNFEPTIKTTIYDRYGKLIKAMNGNQDSWDGTFNGTLLPSTDYWFKVELESGKIYRGHFALKR